MTERMSQGSYGDRDRSFALAERANALIRDYGPSATPLAYAVWYAYVAGETPLLNDAVKRLTAQNGSLTEDDIQTLHGSYLDRRRHAGDSGDICKTVLGEIASVIEVLDLSLGSTARYSDSLRTLSQDLHHGAVSHDRLCEILATLVSTTREMASDNRTLEARMRESRGEVETLRETLETARAESLTDPLTGLSNRKHFEETLRTTFAGPVARGTPLSLVVLDVDFFKRFNDLYGHLTGDQVLRLVAIVMRESAGTGAMLARFGGEEFAVILLGVDRAGARQVAEKIRASVMGRELVKRSTGTTLGRVTVSLGVASYRSGDTPATILERADLCMFAAKRAGRNRTFDDAVAVLTDVA